VLKLRSLALDCDGDALLIGADALGPTCHRETRSCFDPDELSHAVPGFDEDRSAAPGPGSLPIELPDANDAWQGFAWLEHLWATIDERATKRPEGSYTVELLDGGVDVAGRKVTEEATEVLLAAKNDERAEAAGADRAELRGLLAGEAADLVYHSLVLLAERGLPPREVIATLRSRHGDPVGG
jgi:phosphoribosyl-ATP pyrophosphohydrolase/phosphoribosyl-AMP cyclohydrolase